MGPQISSHAFRQTASRICRAELNAREVAIGSLSGVQRSLLLQFCLRYLPSLLEVDTLAGTSFTRSKLLVLVAMAGSHFDGIQSFMNCTRSYSAPKITCQSSRGNCSGIHSEAQIVMLSPSESQTYVAISKKF